MEEQANRIGQRLGNYMLLRLLGEGGFAQVYLGEHIHLGTKAAVKVLNTRLASADIESFRTEARTIAHLVHPHIIRVFEFDVQDNVPFLVMDYAEGGTLRERYPKNSILPPKTIVSYTQQIAGALQYAHDKKIVHRDIKPPNMLLNQQGQVLLSDFGIAITIQNTQSSNTNHDIRGTASYIAPEQLNGHPLPASDQYALGIVVYEWLCGERPFRGTFTELCTQHLLATPPSMREKMPTVSPALEQVVMTALAKDPAQRFDSVNAFALALQQACTAQQQGVTSPSQAASAMAQDLAAQQTYVMPSQPTPPPTENNAKDASNTTPLTQLDRGMNTPQVGLEAQKGLISSRDTGGFEPQATPNSPRVSRRTALVTGLIGLAGAGIGVTWFLTSQTSHSTRQTSPSRQTAASSPTSPQPTPSSTPAPVGATLYRYTGHNNTVNMVAWSPDDSWIASSGEDKTVQIWNPMKGNRLLIYTAHTAAVYTLAWSPDGKRIASGSYDKTVRVWDVEDGGHTFTYIYKDHDNDIDKVAWSPDGKRIAVIGVRTMEAWNAADGGQLIRYQKGLGSARAVAWSPDSRWIASGGNATIYIWNGATGKQEFTYQGHSDRVNTIAWSPDGKRIASGGKDKTVRVWDAITGGNLVIYRDHHDYVSSISWSPDSTRIVSGGNDTTAQVWDAATGRHIFTYRGHSSDVNTVAWSHNGKLIASGDDGKSAQIWRAP